VDHRRYAKACDRHWFRKTFNLAPGAKTVGVIAQFIARKGHRYLIASIPDILAVVPQAHFLFFGKGPLEADIQRLCGDHNLLDHITFAGFRDDLDSILPCLDLVVHPATMEGLGVSLLQAAASGVPIVASPVGGIPEIVQHQKNGLLINPLDTSALIQAAISILSNSELAARLGKKGVAIVKDRFSIEAMIAGNLRIYNRILHPNRQQSPI
jgi:glycosyltransferase involved in cell wall biosynthesis